MKKIRNSLYILTQGTYLYKDGETIAVSVNKEVKQRFPIHNQSNILCFGNVLCTPALMGFCGERGVGMAFFSENGKFLARVQGPVSGNILLRKAQYALADNISARSAMARRFVVAKIANCRSILQRAIREYPGNAGNDKVISASSYMMSVLKGLEYEMPIDSVRGNEGDAARKYFAVFDNLITAQKDSFYFKERTRRPPMDNVNALLSFAYTLLAHDMVSALEGVGLDPASGFLHADRPGRPGLALDLMEEFRPVFVDRLILNLINRRQVKGADFVHTESGAVIMGDSAIKELIKSYQERKKKELTHPFLDEKMPLGLLPHVQAMLLARFIRGDINGYPPFRWR